MKVINELNEKIEINGLILISLGINDFKEDIIGQLNGLCLNGESFYKRYCKIYEKYVVEFSKNMILEKSDEIFFKEDNLGLMFASIALIEENIPETDDEFRELILNKYLPLELNEPINSVEGIVNMLYNNETLKDEEKWRLLEILKNPVMFFERFNRVINNNREGYLNALKAIDKKYLPLVKRYKSTAEEYSIECLGDSYKREDIVIYPSMAYGLSFLIIKGRCFCGLLNNDVQVERKKKANTSAMLLSQLKSISDKSKLEIMIYLKEGWKYSQEIADKLDLTPATVSYHMNALLNCGMVKIEKKNSKAYYQINEKLVGEFLRELEDLLIDK